MSLALQQRFNALREAANTATSDEPPFRIEPGSIDDYRAMARFHYRSQFPGAVTAIIRAVIDEPSLTQRFRGAVTPHASTDHPIGVLLISLPSPACRLRDLATADRYRNLGPREGTSLLNRARSARTSAKLFRTARNRSHQRTGKTGVMPIAQRT